MDAATLLSNSLSADNNVRAQATQQLEQAAQENFPAYMLTLANELANEHADNLVRNAAGLAIKNALTGRESQRQHDLAQRWLALPSDARTSIKHPCLVTLGSANKRASAVAAQAVSAIAAIELPQGEWQDLIGTLLDFVQRENTNLRIATLQAIGYICEVVRPEVLATRSNEILTAVVQGARKEETSAEVQQAAIQALYNSLEFIKDNFEREGERNYIMQVVCEATQSTHVVVQIGAFECLVRIMQLYYDKMALYMERALFGLTVLGMQNEEEKVALQAVEFWSTVCEEEAELAIEAAEAAEYGQPPDIESRHFAKIALPEILPVILSLLMKQDEDAEDDEWNVSMSAGTCVGLLASVVGDAIVPLVIPFIEANIQDAAEWRKRDAAVMVFGSILDGPDDETLTPLVLQALPTLINMMHDPQPAVKDTVAWTLGRITDLMFRTIDPQVHLQPLIQAVGTGLQDSGRIAANCCWAIKNLAVGYGPEYTYDGQEQATNALSPYYQALLETLMQTSENRPNNEGNARTAAYEAIAVLIANAPHDSVNFAEQVGNDILARMERLLTLHNQLVGADDRNSWNELQGNCCSVTQAIIRKVEKAILPAADRIMNILLGLLANSAKDAAVAEDAFMTISTLVIAIEQDFEKYVSHTMGYIQAALATLDEFQVFTSAVGVTGDIARAIHKAIGPYCNDLLSALLAALASPVLHRTAKPTVVAVFGDIAIALGQDFTQYLDSVMGMLSQAGQVKADTSSDIAMQEFVWSMRDSITEAFTGILSGFRENPAPFAPYVSGVLNFIAATSADEEVSDNYLRSCLNLLGDMASVYGSQIQDQLLQPQVTRMLGDGKKRGVSKSTQQAYKYARKAIKDATS
ncbi:hypothetical protein QFC21_005699 [Naganishia friedmannii]|uniref:Uncharacterized protein n=1 Tax=Naganishia friedmannii TaxID=89922 RepID=A0ACC2V7J7_9TREE|nr:hypothetical protein QFC21_005699 [Naganishia friedmannii]